MLTRHVLLVQVAVLDYSSQQQKLMPMLSKAYALHFATRFLVSQYAESKQTKADDLVADVHALSAGACLLHRVLVSQKH